MHQSAIGASGGASRDDALSSRAVVSVADRLRNLADWLDVHPAAHVSTVNLIDAGFGGAVTVHDYSPKNLADLLKRAARIGGEWRRTERELDHSLVFCQTIMPGVVFEMVAARTTADLGDAA